MRNIVKPNGEVYRCVSVDEKALKLVLASGHTVVLDAKIIPQLRQLLTEAEFLKVI